MKKDHLLPQRLAEAKQQLFLLNRVLPEAMEGKLMTFHTDQISDRERFVFYLVDPDGPSGGILVLKQTIDQPDNQPPTINVLVQYLDDFISQFRRRELLRANDEWQKLCRRVERKLYKRAA